MIQAVLLIALGFLTATLMGVLIAPSLWHRAYRLSRKRLEQSLPISLSEIEASRDQLKAVYAVRMRRLETALASAKQKAAIQLVDNSRLQMQIVTLKDQIAGLDLKLAERHNAASVLEQTITKRFPVLDREITAVKRELQERSFEIQDLTNKLAQRSEDLEGANREAASYQSELARLREAFEKNSADRTGRRVRRASQWSLEDYRAEYDRLNLELSRLRQQLAQLQDKDAQQSVVIKGELQRLSELILVSAQPKGGPAVQDQLEPVSIRAAQTVRMRDRPAPWLERASPDAEKDGIAKGNGSSGLPGRDARSSGKENPAPAAAPADGKRDDGRTSPQEADGLAISEMVPATKSPLLREAVPDRPAAALTSSPKNGALHESEAGAAARMAAGAMPAVSSGDRQVPSLTLLERLKEAAVEPSKADE